MSSCHPWNSWVFRVKFYQLGLHVDLHWEDRTPFSKDLRKSQSIIVFNQIPTVALHKAKKMTDSNKMRRISINFHGFRGFCLPDLPTDLWLPTSSSWPLPWSARNAAWKQPEKKVEVAARGVAQRIRRSCIHCISMLYLYTCISTMILYMYIVYSTCIYPASRQQPHGMILKSWVPILSCPLPYLLLSCLSCQASYPIVAYINLSVRLPLQSLRSSGLFQRQIPCNHIRHMRGLFVLSGIQKEAWTSWSTIPYTDKSRNH